MCSSFFWILILVKIGKCCTLVNQHSLNHIAPVLNFYIRTFFTLQFIPLRIYKFCLFQFSRSPPKSIHREGFSRRSSTVGPGFNTMKPKISCYAHRQGNPSRKMVQPKSRWSLLHPKVTGVLIEKTLMHIFSKIRLFEVQPCADPESYARGGPTLTTFFWLLLGEGGSKYHYKRTIIGQPVKLYLNGVSLVGRSWLRGDDPDPLPPLDPPVTTKDQC